MPGGEQLAQAAGFRGDPLWRALGLLGLRGKPIAASLGLGILGAGSALALAALSAWLIMRAWEMPPVLYLSVAVTAVRALGISRGLFRYLERLATHDLALDAMSIARARLYLALAQGPPGYSVSLRRGELLARTGTDVDEIGNAVIRALIPIGVSLVVSGAAVAIMTVVSVWAALALAVCLLVSGVAAPWLAARGAARATREGEAGQVRSADAVMTLLDHAPELAVARRRPDVLAEAQHAEIEVEKAADHGAAQGAWGAAAIPLAVGVSVIVAALVGVGLAGQVSPMTLGVLILLPLSAFESTGVLTEAALQLQRSRNAAGRIMSMIDRSADYEDVPPQGSAVVRRGHVRIRGLRWGWPGGAVFGGAAGIDLDIEPGTRIAVVGPSGCGKSTLLLTIAGLLPPVAGAVSTASADDGIGARYFAEDGHIFATSVRENLLVSRGDANDEMLASAIAKVGLAGWATELPNGLGTVLEAGADSVSGGQRRRLLLARALINPSPVLLIDEPGENLDPDDAAALQAALLDSAVGLVDPERAVVMVTHQLPVAHRADRVLEMTELSLADKSVADPGYRE